MQQRRVLAELNLNTRSISHMAKILMRKNKSSLPLATNLGSVLNNKDRSHFKAGLRYTATLKLDASLLFGN